MVSQKPIVASRGLWWIVNGKNGREQSSASSKVSRDVGSSQKSAASKTGRACNCGILIGRPPEEE